MEDGVKNRVNRRRGGKIYPGGEGRGNPKGAGERQGEKKREMKRKVGLGIGCERWGGGVLTDEPCFLFYNIQTMFRFQNY